jgi:hypothetical protein
MLSRAGCSAGPILPTYSRVLSGRSSAATFEDTLTERGLFPFEALSC